MHRTAATLGFRPEFLNGFDQTWCAVADDEPRRAESTPREIATEIQPVLVRLTLSETHRVPLREPVAIGVRC